MGALEASDQVYSLSSTAEGENGGVTLNTSTNVIDIKSGSTSNFVHEMTHAGQFEAGDMAFDSKTGNTLAQDIYDEVSAYKAQFAYNPSSVSGLTSTVGMRKALTVYEAHQMLTKAEITGSMLSELCVGQESSTAVNLLQRSLKKI